MRINRLFEIIYILIDKKQISVKELADYSGVSERTIYRDVKILSNAGIPIYMIQGKGGGIKISSDYVRNKKVITEQEKKNILSSLKSLNYISKSFEDAKEDWIEVDLNLWSHRGRAVMLFKTVKHSILQKKYCVLHIWV